ncbi:MAG: hypothetical protein E6767_07505 [Dysgonomonas sp.]|nr:hypothetical protein [Dysgonomonas sp.]
MKNFKIFSAILLFILLGVYSCTNHPIDDDGLLITDDRECHIKSFELLGPDHRSVLFSREDPDTINCIVTAVAKFGTNLKHVKPYVSVPKDAKVEPAMGDWVDFTQPRQYTVISGNRKIKKTYTITVTLQGE